MNVLSEREIIEKIEREEPFSARVATHAFDLKIDRYAPCIGTAIHDGHRIPSAYERNLLITENERRFEEDPYTGELLEALPIALVVNDSRYLYDLNRTPEKCIYNEAWGKQVWKKPLSEREQIQLLDLHACYYHILNRLIDRLETMYGRTLIYDLHSFNYSRINGDAPLFNIGTYSIHERYSSFLEILQRALHSVALPGVETRCAFDEVFQGKGYQAAFVKQKHPQSLCVPLEIKKIFMNENRFERYHGLYEPLKQQLRTIFLHSADKFYQQFVTDELTREE